MLLSNSVLFAA